MDLRSPSDFATYHFPSAINKPLLSLAPNQESPFQESAVLELQWTELEEIFGSEEVTKEFAEMDVLVVCYGGDTARVASSVLRARGVRGWSLAGGMDSVKVFL